MTPEERWHAYRECFSSPAGQEVLKDLRFHFGYEKRSTIDAESPHKTYAAEGQRTVLVFVRGILDSPLPAPAEDGIGEAEFEPKPQEVDDEDDFDATGP